MPMDVDRISPDALVGDVVMKSEETPFLAAARAKGCMIQVGTDMLFEQIPAYLEFLGFPTTTADDLRRQAGSILKPSGQGHRASPSKGMSRLSQPKAAQSDHYPNL